MSNDCWQWGGTVFNTGYGAISLGTVAMGTANTYLVHRTAYQILVVELPNELKLDHLCRNRLCWRPDHLEPVTDRVNILRGEALSAQNARKNHCPKGHPFSGDNLYQRPGHSDRRCRACAIEGTPGRTERARLRRQAAREAARLEAA